MYLFSRCAPQVLECIRRDRFWCDDFSRVLATLTYAVGLHTVSSEGPAHDQPVCELPSWFAGAAMVETQHGILLHTMLNGEGYHFDAARPPAGVRVAGQSAPCLSAAVAGLSEERAAAVNAAPRTAGPSGTAPGPSGTAQPVVLGSPLRVAKDHAHSDRVDVRSELSASGGRVKQFEVELTPSATSQYPNAPADEERRNNANSLRLGRARALFQPAEVQKAAHDAEAARKRAERAAKAPGKELRQTTITRMGTLSHASEEMSNSDKLSRCELALCSRPLRRRLGRPRCHPSRRSRRVQGLRKRLPRRLRPTSLT